MIDAMGMMALGRYRVCGCSGGQRAKPEESRKIFVHHRFFFG
jgi:hypothetical protein